MAQSCWSSDTVTSGFVSLLELHFSDNTPQNIFFTRVFEIKPVKVSFFFKNSVEVLLGEDIFLVVLMPVYILPV